MPSSPLLYCYASNQRYDSTYPHSENGKTTTLKNFRLKYARSAWKQERASWHAVIQLNILLSTDTILGVLQAEMDGSWSAGQTRNYASLSREVITTGIIDGSVGDGPRMPISPVTPTSPSTPMSPWAQLRPSG
ncbi:hypothetical protein BDQ12DRAFT_306165 [Crucibulum laeve]|uniref:Uncharacterized protein n=1 Tax=Crucibulum laeve TaxID=68775 RepID=A0A5C3LT27_9AGAR|nr:hypothetical protein BDQ12DRAFT_306165 [Crucibulum laeve]